MLDLLLALLLVVAMLLTWAAAVQLLVRADSPLRQVPRRLHDDALVRRATADLDRAYVRLLDAHRRTP